MVASRRRPCAPGGATQMLVIINDVDRGQERGSPSRQTRTSHLARHEFRLVSGAAPDAEAFEQYWSQTVSSGAYFQYCNSRFVIE